jgi:DNA segregation ATPase FtsK/SpoIIIE-like protein
LPRTTSARTPVPEYALPEGQASETLKRRVVQHAARKAAAPSRRAMADAQPSLPLQAEAEAYEFPPLTLLTSPETIERHHLSDTALEENARMLESVLDDYGVKGDIVSVRPGPVVTMYELEPAPGLKASRVIGLADDIARSMSALSARVSTVPGRSVIGIELPNQHREKVVLREILSHRDFGDGTHRLPLALGKDIGGDPIIANLAKMPHLLIAGTTGSGKSVAINTMILSLLYKLTPEECRMIMIDPKMLELSVYDGIPHLLSPVVTDPKKAVVALKWVVGEMEERYRKMSKMGVRNIDGYNGRVAEALSKGEMFKRTVQTGFDDETGEPVFETEEFAPEKMPYIVVIVDEMADLMMVAGKEIEACIQRLAQMARASGIHIIMATQRPSVDVITGTIKANFPTRISFHVTSKVDSRTILGEWGPSSFWAWATCSTWRVGRRSPASTGLSSRRGGRGDRQPPQELRSPRLCRERAGRPRRGQGKRYRRGSRPQHRGQHHGRGRALRPGGGDRHQGPQVLHLLHPAQARHRLQQGRAAGGADGGTRARLAGQPRRQARDPGAGTGMSGASPVAMTFPTTAWRGVYARPRGAYMTGP